MTSRKSSKIYILSALSLAAFISFVWAKPIERDFYSQETHHFESETLAESDIEELSTLEVSDEVLQSLIKNAESPITPPDTSLQSPIPQPDNNPLDPEEHYTPFHLSTPPSLNTSIEYNPETNTYEFQNMIGSTPYGPASSLSIDDFIDYDLQQEIRNYWRDKGANYAGSANRRGGGLIPQIKVGSDIFESIFGSDVIDIRPAGNIEITFGVLHNYDKNPNLAINAQRHTDFNFDQNIQLSLMAKVGDKINFNLNYNSEANFDMDNKMKLKYEGKEDDIIQLLEFGDVTLPLSTTLITGSQNLFGLKTALKFGKLTVTAVASSQSSESQTTVISGGAQTEEFYFKADEYEDNKHFFIAQYFRDHYNEAMATLPLISSPIVITKIEVWRTTVGAATQDNRNIIAFTDLGEFEPQSQILAPNQMGYPCDNSNNLLTAIDTSLYRNLATASNNLRARGLTAGIDYEKVESARLLNPSEYTFNSKLGFISLNTSLSSDQVLAVAFQYQVIGDDQIYQVGEFSNEVAAPNCIRVKLLKSTSLNTKSPLWKLMMKNVYNLQAYQISNEKFRLNILYTGDDEGVANGFFNLGAQKGIPLIRLMGLDRLNQQQDPAPDGIFDFIDNADVAGGTIVSKNGRIFFPTIEPFGKDLRAVLTDPEIADRYCFDSLYTMTQELAQQYTSKNKFFIEGTYSSSTGSEFVIQGAANLQEGSVVVTAGGNKLIENVHYTVNYSMATVTIIDEGILKSGTPISITTEENSMMGNTKRMFGANLDYEVNRNFRFGGSILNLSELPISSKVNYGDEPINNMIWGLNLSYKTKVPFITKLVDFLPFYSTTAESNFQVDAEFAHFVPGHSRLIGKEGITYIDDFEASKSTIDLKSYINWSLASTPQGQPSLFREALAVSEDDSDRRKLAYGFNRANFNWYIIDPMFYYKNDGATPPNIDKEEQSKPYARAVYEPELFPSKEYQNNLQSTNMSVFDMTFYPTERGPYNYDVAGNEGFSAGVNEDGTLKDPKSRWGGIMRKFDNTDFDSYNYEYIEFWMMDPFIENPNHEGGKLYFNLGDISEDILRDGRKFFENGLPGDGSDTDVEYTAWGRVPTQQQIINAFESSDENARPNQDVGFDGLRDDQERTHFQNAYLSLLAQEFGMDSPVYQQAAQDPSSDNFHHFRGTDYDEQELGIVERYRYYNNAQGNTPTQSSSNESYLTIGRSQPDVEDVNNDNTLSEDERYYQYVIDLRPDKMVVGENYINDIYEAIPERLPNGTNPATKWYQFRIPIKNPDAVIGNISGFSSIRFLRVFMRDFSEPIICRLATFELIRSDWRACTESLIEDGDYMVPVTGDDNTQINIGTLSYEENANRVPVPYVLPPGIEREKDASGMNVIQRDEQSLTLKVTNLRDGDARAVYKNMGYDLRQFERLKMFIHAEDVENSGDLNPGDITVFVRIGSDFTDNYYEYEIPVVITPWGIGKDSAAIWPLANRLDILLDSLVAVKQARNIAVRAGSHPSNIMPFTQELDNGNKVTVMGMPNLSDVSAILIGVRNPKKRGLNDGDDMMPKSVMIWLNELRLTGFDDKSGVAALARMRMNLADLGDVSFSTTVSTAGFGSLEQSITQRAQETQYSVDVAANIDGGKVLFPQKWNVKIPIHYDYSLTGEMPLYNPLNPDVHLSEDLLTYETMRERDSIRHMTTAIVQRQNVNLTNVRKERNLDKPLKMRPWDIENFDVSYAYSEVKIHDVDVEFDNEFSHEGQLGYTFSHNPKNIRVFAKARKMKSKWLQLIKDFNFTPMPKSFVFRTTVLREFNEFKFRPKSQGNIIIDTSFVKNFMWTRNYALQWDLAQSLKFEYRADATARLDEPDGRIDTRQEKDSIWHSFGQGGRMNYFTQRFDASWNVPINKIPLFNWINANVRYSGTYNYTGAALSMQHLGNTIDNSNTLQGNASINFVTLYNNIPYLKKVNQGIKRNNKKKNEGKDNKRGTLGSDDDVKKAGRKETAKNDKDGKDSVKTKSGIGKLILDGTLRVLMLVRNASLNYSEGNGTSLPGYMGEPDLFGIDFTNSSPGFLFAFGGQPNMLKAGAEGGWLTTDTLMTSAFSQRHNQTINFRSTVEPFKDFRIDVTANRVYSRNFSEYYRYSPNGSLTHFSPQENGNFTITTVALRTFFRKAEDVFQEFRAIRHQMAEQIAAQNPNSVGVDAEGFPIGYNGVSPEVLAASFLATYAGRDPAKMDPMQVFPSIPLPNWRLNYNGFAKIKGINKVFQNLTLTHTYTCQYAVGNFASNLLFSQDANGHPNTMNALGNFIHSREFSQISLNEQFSPLIGFDMTLKNSLTLKVEYKKSRNVSLSFANNQITEILSNEISFAAGYRFKDLKIGVVFSGAKRQIVSDLNVTLGFSIKDNMTTLRKLVEETTQVSAGALAIDINATADYQISKMVGLRFYYTQSINKPYIQLSYDTMNIDAGITVRLMLTQ